MWLVRKYDCGHACCMLRDNPYHRHTHSPDECDWCLGCLVAALQADR